MRVEVEHLAHRFGKGIYAVLAAWLGIELNLIVTKAQRPRNELARGKVARQNRPALHEAISSSAVLSLLLRHHRLITGTNNLITGWHNQGDVTGGPIGGVIVKRKPARRIKQVRAFRPHIGQSLRRQGTAFR